MTITIVTVHPAVTIVQADQEKFELPTAWFSNRPEAGQQWTLDLHRLFDEREKIEQLNTYLRRDDRAT